MVALSCLESLVYILEKPPGDAGLSGVDGVSGLETARELVAEVSGVWDLWLRLSSENMIRNNQEVDSGEYCRMML